MAGFNEKMVEKEQKNTIWLTNFCDSLRIFTSIIMIQIIVIIYSLSFLSYDWNYVSKLSVLSLMSQLVGLVVLIVLCKLQNFFNRMNVIKGIVVITLFVILLTSIIAQSIGRLDLQLTFHLFENQIAINMLNVKLSLSTVLICWALIRYFYIQDQWHQQIEKLAEAKLNALQARIKPHFLFNSLNSIASLISLDATKAEKAIVDFSSLMRRTFTHKQQFISLSQELLWVRQYLSIEKLRLGERLNYQIECPKKLQSIEIPVLCLQPLVENSVIHGIAPMPEGGKILVEVKENKNILSIKVENPFIMHESKNSNGMALRNIKQRLALHYGNKAFLSQVAKKGIFTVIIGIPL